MKQAKVTLTADIRGFKSAMKEAERALGSVGQAAQNMSATGLQASGQNLYGGGGSGMGGIPPVGGGMGGGAKGGGGFGGMMGGKLKGFLAGYLTMAAAKAGYARGLNITDQRLAQRSLTQGGEVIGDSSSLGFTTDERRGNAARFARQAGGINGQELTKMTDLGEKIERAYGVSQEQQSGFVGAARRAGARDPNTQMKIMSSAVGAAVKAGLEGGQIGEYLQGMESYLSEMSEGVNIDSGSLNGFAGALSSMPFFRSSPERAFAALRGMNSAFQDGDAFQQAQATRAILKSAPNSGASSTEMRKEMGLFGEINPETIAKLKGMGVDTRALEVKPEQIIKNIFDEIKSNTKDMSKEDQIFALGKRLGVGVSAAADIYAAGGTGDFSKAAGLAKKATMTPEERLSQTFTDAEKEMKELAATMSRLTDAIVMNLIPPLVTIANVLTKLTGGAEKDYGKVSFKGTMDEIKSQTRAGGFKPAGSVGTGGGADGAVVKALKEIPEALNKNTKATNENTKASKSTNHFRVPIPVIGQGSN
jgi:hypothetical protein